MYYMDEIISLRVDKKLRERMRMLDHINWSAVLRRAIAEQIEKEHKIDKKRAERASKMMDEIRNSGVFNKGKSSVEIIREWRNKRK
jgi:post-segregation antitoxin (ccd killing protein)